MFFYYLKLSHKFDAEFMRISYQIILQMYGVCKILKMQITWLNTVR